MNVCWSLIVAGMLLHQTSNANAQFGGGLGDLINKKLNKQNKPNTQPPAAESVATNNTAAVNPVDDSGKRSQRKRTTDSAVEASVVLPPLFEAARQGDALQFAELLKKDMSSINKTVRQVSGRRFDYGDVSNEVKKFAEYTPLAFAAENGCTNIIQQLVDVEVDTKSLHDPIPLSLAAGNGHIEAVKMLVKAGAAPGFGVRAACKKNQPETLKTLIIEAGARGSLVDLQMAAENGYAEIVQILLERSPSGGGLNSLCRAVAKDHEVSSNEEEARAHMLDAFRRAAVKGHLDVVKIFVANGAGLTGDGLGDVIEKAREANQAAVVAYLKDVNNSPEAAAFAKEAAKAKDAAAKAKEETEKETARAKARSEAAEMALPTSQVIELKKAMYGIPLGASMDEIRKWYEEKNAEVVGDTKEGIDEACRAVVTRAKSYGLPGIEIGEKEAIQYDKIEQNLDKADKFNENNSGGADLSPFIKALRTLCKGVKNPTVSYKGKTFILPSIESLEPANAYALLIKPSEAMKNDSIKVIQILLKKKGDGLISYGAAVTFERSEFSKIAEALNAKYGADSSNGDNRLEELHRITGLSKFERYHGTSISQWRKNILMAGNEPGSFNDIMVLYYDVDAAKQLLDEQKAAYRAMEEKGKLEEQKKQEKLKDNF